MTKEQADELAHECESLIRPETTDVWAMPCPLGGWMVRFLTGTMRTTITERIPAANAAIHKRSL